MGTQSAVTLPTDPAALLNEAETASLTGLSRKTLQAHRWRGVGIPFYRLSPTCVRYRRADIDAFLAACRVETRAA